MTRPRTIGGTDVAAILGLHPYRSALDVWARCAGLSEDDQPDNPRMAWGRRLEPVVLDAYEEQTGAKLDRGGTVTLAAAPWAHGSLDARVQGGGAIVDAKTTRDASRWGAPGTDEMPAEVACQLMHYAWLADAPAGHAAVLVAGSDFRIYCLPRDEEMIGLQVEACAKFWRDHVMTGTPPDVDGSEACARYLARRWPRHEAELLTATPEIEEAIGRLRDARAEVATAEERQRLAEAEIKAWLGEHEGCTSSLGKLTWKAGKPTQRLDLDRLRAEHPEVARACTVTLPASRRFTVPRSWSTKQEE